MAPALRGLLAVSFGLPFRHVRCDARLQAALSLDAAQVHPQVHQRLRDLRLNARQHHLRADRINSPAARALRDFLVEHLRESAVQLQADY